MNLTPNRIIIIGAAVVFGIPIAIGIVVGHFHGWLIGVIAEVALLVFILTITLLISDSLRKSRPGKNKD